MGQVKPLMFSLKWLVESLKSGKKDFVLKTKYYRLNINAYFFLCLFFLKRFLRLWVAILCLLRFLPLGIIIILKCVLVI
jgi:hypothetical protein